MYIGEVLKSAYFVSAQRCTAIKGNCLSGDSPRIFTCCFTLEVLTKPKPHPIPH